MSNSSMMTSACDLQVLILLLLFSIPNPFQGNKKNFGEKLLKKHVWSFARDTAAGTAFVLAYEGGKADESPPGSKDTGDVYEAR